ncbi:MotE family protein [Nitratireductor aquimarinus]|uniref:MotE family protein n=1 Tax=Nitratireductor aquimarinus TaxID=889300 RepID=UPI0019D351E0|nr:MotE family protein [Nitratireductor aquimarinus]MBY6021679.1 MotE family protein [Nitratireductor sp. DP7N14-4]
MSRRNPLKKIATGAFAGVLLAAQLAPLHALAAENPATMKPAEVERFCANIADAARDRRYALQAMELEKLKGEVDERIAALEQKRADYEGWLQRRNIFLAQAEAGIVEIYSSMRPDAAAERLAEVRVELAAAILMKLEPRTAGIILNEMNSKSAATLTTIIASAARPEDPS